MIDKYALVDYEDLVMMYQKGRDFVLFVNDISILDL